MFAGAGPAFGGDFALVAVHPDAARQPTTQGKTLAALAPFNGRLYAGFGDADANTGPIGIRAFDPIAGRFGDRLLESRTEAVWNFREIGGRLYAPHIDPWPGPPPPQGDPCGYAVGTPGVAGADTWADVTPVVAGHMYDMATLGGDLWMVGAQVNAANTDSTAAAWRSRDGGGTWQLALSVPPQPGGRIARFYGAHGFRGKLYVQAVDAQESHPASKVFDGAGWSDGPSLVPSGWIMWRPETFAGRMVYRLAYPGQAAPLYQFDGASAAAATDDLLLDYTVSGGVLFGLRDDGRVVRTADLLTWQVLDPTPVADGRSLALLDGWLYVGATEGRLYRYSAQVPEPSVSMLALVATAIGVGSLGRRRSS